MKAWSFILFGVFMTDVARARPQDIRPVLASYQGRDIATEFIERSREHQRCVYLYLVIVSDFFISKAKV